MKQVELYGVSNGTSIDFNDPVARDKIAKFLELKKGEAIRTLIEVVKNPKSVAQMRFYRGVLLPAICRKAGISSRTAMHQFLKGEYLTRTVEVVIDGEIRTSEFIPSAADLTVQEMYEFIEEVKEFAMDLGVQLNHDEVDTYETAMLGDGETPTLF